MNLNVGTFYSKTLSTTGGQAPYLYELVSGSFPSLMTLDSILGLIYGTVTETGIYPFSIVSVDNNGCSNTGSFSITASCPVIKVSIVNSTGITGIPYSSQITASGGSVPYTSSITPAAWTGSGFGNANYNNIYRYAGVHDTKPYWSEIGLDSIVRYLYYNGFSGGDVYCLNPTLSDVNGDAVAYFNTDAPNIISGSYTTEGGSDSIPFGGTILPVFQGTGSLPPGLTLNTASGGISGTPTQTGSYYFFGVETDQFGCSGYSLEGITVTCPNITIIPASSILTGSISSSFSQTFSTISGSAPFTFFTSSGIPPGLTFSSAALTGTPTTEGYYTFTISCQDTYGCGVSNTYTMIIDPIITLSDLPVVQVGQIYV